MRCIHESIIVGLASSKHKPPEENIASYQKYYEDTYQE